PDSIKVFVRVRPLTQGTGLTTDGDQSLCLTVTSPNTIRLLSKPEPRTFTYDHVADMDTSQDSVFSSVAKNIVESCMNGYNGTIFAYGQTGSGKTFTMLGPSELDNFTDELRGVIPRSFEYLFFLINREVERSAQSKSFLCKCSFIEIYNEQIYDLLDTASASLFLRENIKKGVFVEGAVEKFVNSAAGAYQVLSMGWRNRRVASTSMNRESSRSHAVFTMTLESKESINDVVNIRMSQLNLVDLAGSERQKDTHTEGSRLKEASSINRSLMCLGQVIMALVDVSNGKNRHICYRDSKLTFLLRDSLGGNAKTYIIANVHPGSKCFGETLSTLQFAQRAKLIKNKAVINEDTQGNVRQLQAEVKKLKEQLVQALASHTEKCFIAPSFIFHDHAVGGNNVDAVELTVMSDCTQMLLEKVAQLEEAWTQKDKFIHSSRMIVRFREDHICRLEKKLKAGPNQLSDEESQALIDQLKEEIKILRDQVDHHPKMTRYAAENFSLREENRHLRSLESVVRAEEGVAQVAAELEEAFETAMESERGAETSSTPAAAESVSTATMERLKAQLLQKQSDLTAALRAFEEYREVTKKQMSQLESDKRYLDKSNRHLENILEATNAYKKQEVSELNRIHVETIKEQASRVQSQLNDEELNNSKLLQQIAKLEEQIAVMSQESRHKDECQGDHVFLRLLSVLRSEISDLRLVLQSSDKELAAVKDKLSDEQREQQRETSQLSNSLISTQLQLDKVQLEWEQLLEQHRTLQDSFDQLQAEAKFEADQSGHQLQERQQQIDGLKAQLMVSELINSTMDYFSRDLTQVLESQERELENRRTSMMTMEILLAELNAERAAKNEEIQRLKENEVLRKQIAKLSEENGKLVGHKNHKQRIEYLVKLKKDNTKLQEDNEKLRTEITLMRDNAGDDLNPSFSSV
uniref:Kinesin-like protein n=1 Tax=Scophthalmus maximus TaxID=52904 RepID=A0A8D3CZQ0_SCOMX